MDFRILGKVVPQPSSTILGVTVAAFCPEQAPFQFVDLDIDTICAEIEQMVSAKQGNCRPIVDGLWVRLNPKTLGSWAKLNQAISDMNFDQASVHQYTYDIYRHYKEIKIENL